LRSFVIYALFGLASGALTGLVALGVVVVYRASGVVNFSASALGAIAAYTCYSLRDHGLPGWFSLLVGLVLGAALGALTHGAMALLRGASLLAKLMVTLGLFTSAQAFTLIVWGPVVTSPAGFLPTRGFGLGGTLRIGEDRIILIIAALALGALLVYVYSRTMFGLATSAVSESPRFAASSGWSTGRIELINFMIAGLLSAGAAIFLAPIIGLSGSVIAGVILPALAAALVGRFASFGKTIAAVLVIGVCESEMSFYSNDIAKALHVGALSLSGLPDAVPLATIVVLTTVRGKARLQRGEIQAKLPYVGDGRVSMLPLGIAVAAVIAVLVGAGGPGGWSVPMIATVAYGLLVLSVIVVTGYAGQLSLCQFALAGFGGWGAARVAAASGIPFLLALVLGVVAAVILGLAIALPAVRARGMSLAVATLALALLLNDLIFTNTSLTGGYNGISVKNPEVFGLNLDPIAHPARYAIFGLVLFVLGGLAVANVRRGRSGLRLLAIRSDEQAAASLGVGVYGAKLYAFAVGAGLAGLAGAYLAFQFPSAQFTTYDAVSSVSVVQFTVLGGLGWISGSVVGAAGGTGGILSHFIDVTLGNISNVDTWLGLVTGLLLALVLRTAPDGFASVWASAFNQPSAEQDRIRVRVGVVPWRVLGLTEMLAAILLTIGLVATPLEYVGAVAMAAAMLVGVFLERRAERRRVRRVAARVAAVAVALSIIVLRIDYSPIALFILSQVLAAPVLGAGAAKLSRRFLEAARLPRARAVVVTARSSRQPAALEVRGVTVRFGGVLAMDDVSLAVRPGEIVGLIGPNGAGKTTALDVMTGFTRPTSGHVALDGEITDTWSPERCARAGIVRSWQGVGLFEAMTIKENLLVAADAQHKRSYAFDLVSPGRLPFTEGMVDAVRQLGLEDVLDRRPSSLSQGTMRVAGIARALVADPRVLLLDEPAAGLDAVEGAELAEVIRNLADRTGIGVLVVEHDVPLLLGLCDRLVVLDFGRVITEGTPAEIENDPRVIAAYLGAATPDRSKDDAVGRVG
jgi:ABC-type branched-subunit amino acid transport system ATPase component/ABC-type branched-subunit amino acid transport system permease subunit